MGITNKPFSDILNFTRASTKWVWNGTGTLVEVPVDAPAYDHDPVTGEALGVLIEEARTNYFPRNADLATYLNYVNAPADGNANRTAITSTEIGLPGLSLEAIADGAVGAGTIDSLVSSADDYALSAYVKPNSADIVTIATDRTGGGDAMVRANLDTATQEVSMYSTTGGGSVGGYYVGKGWWRLWLNRPPEEGTSGDKHFRVYASGLLAGDTVELAGVQAEIGAYSTSYIPTAGAAVTRAADNVSRTLGAEFNGQEGTFVFSFDCSDEFGSVNPIILSATPNRAIEIHNRSGLGRLISVEDGSAAAYSVSPIVPSPGKQKVAISYIEGEKIIYSENGQSVEFSGNFDGFPSIVDLRIDGRRGDDGDTRRPNRNFENVTHYPRAMTALELEALTAP